ncbi:MAG: thermonuclease family protein [Candidatus Omnitrophica bacterium]|nr:thermonuclease family protein [Candidatus Omnitrophota bacterium]
MKKYIKLINVTVLILASIIYLGTKSFVFTNSKEPADADSSFYTVSRVIDGDTIVLSDGRKVRLTGIDTPEVYYSEKLLKDSKKSGQDIKTIQGLGRRASAFTKELCLGKKVRLEYDVDRHDRYKRTLAYVYLEDGTFVNQKIVQEGFAQVMTVVPNVKYADLFLKSQKEAREANRGLWKT